MRDLLPKLALLTGALLFSAVLAEIALRLLLGTPVHFRYPQPHYIADPEIGHWMTPDQESFNHALPLSTNSVGIRGGQYSRVVPDDTHRVLALGDSQTFGNGLSEADTWPALLERQLARDATGLKWQVVNGGLSGTDTWQHERILHRLSEAYEFDTVVLGFYVNDVTGVYSVGDPEKRTNTTQMRIVYSLKRSALISFLSRYGARPDWRVNREQNILTGEGEASVDRGWQQVEESLRGMKAFLDAERINFVILVIPRRDQVSALDPPTAYNARIEQVATRLGIPVVDALSPLRGAFESGARDLFIPWDGHNTGLANEVIADELAPHVQALKITRRYTEGR